MKSLQHFGLWILLLAGLFPLLGCGRDNSPKSILARVNQSNIQRLGNLYNKYQSEHKWIGPSDESTFRTYVADTPPARLDLLGIDPNDIESLFKSERDGENFVFRYKVPGSAMGKVEPVVFEKTGVNGKRMVGFTNKAPIEVDAAEYDAWLAGKYVPENKGRGTGAPNQPGPPNQARGN